MRACAKILFKIIKKALYSEKSCMKIKIQLFGCEYLLGFVRYIGMV